jgi:hypothetical protein
VHHGVTLTLFRARLLKVKVIWKSGVEVISGAESCPCRERGWDEIWVVAQARSLTSDTQPTTRRCCDSDNKHDQEDHAPTPPDAGATSAGRVRDFTEREQNN